MTKVFLLISAVRADITHLRVKCADPQFTDGAGVKDREFASPQDLEHALRNLGVPEYEARAAHNVFHSLQPAFIPVSSEIAKKLGVLD